MGRVIASIAKWMRKVRAPKGTVQDNILVRLRRNGKCNRKYVQADRKVGAVVKSGKPYGVQDQVGLSFRLARPSFRQKAKQRDGLVARDSQ